MSDDKTKWRAELKRALYENFPTPPNFLYRPPFSRSAERARIALYNEVDKEEIYWYKTIVAYREFLRGYYNLALSELKDLLKIVPESKKEKRKLLLLNLALTYFNIAFEAKEIEELLIHRDALGNSEEYIKALLKITKSDDDYLSVDALILFGFFSIWREKYTESADSFASALKLAQSRELNYMEGVAKCYDGIGELHRVNERFSEARRYSTKALEIYERFGKARNIIEIQHNLAFIQWNETKQTPDQIVNKLMPHMNQAMELGDYEVAVTVCRNIAAVYAEAKRLGESKKFLKKAKEISDRFSLTSK